MSVWVIHPDDGVNWGEAWVSVQPHRVSILRKGVCRSVAELCDPPLSVEWTRLRGSTHAPPTLNSYGSHSYRRPWQSVCGLPRTGRTFGLIFALWFGV